MRVELLEDVAYMRPNGMHADEQRRCNVDGGLPVREATKDIGLAP